MELHDDFFSWIEGHRTDDPARLRLKYGKERAAEILQIECRRKYAVKLAATLKSNHEFIFPTALSGEQSTSDRLAAYHAGLIEPGWRVADLTAGLGVDAMALARAAAGVTAVEIDPAVADALRHNAASAGNLTVVCADCREFCGQTVAEGKRFDAVFIDPARRDYSGGRVHALADCRPDVVAMLPLLRKMTRRLIVKASPMLDITHTLGELPGTGRVIALGTPTECKELDIIIDFDESTDPLIEAVTLGADGAEWTFALRRSDENGASVSYGAPHEGAYIYEPFPAVMKTGAMKLLAERFGLTKLAPNTHAWWSDDLVEAFPGHIFKVTEVLPYASKHIKRYASRHPRVGVTARNFDVGADALRAKLGVREGPSRLFALTDHRGNRLLVTTEPLLESRLSNLRQPTAR